MQGRIRVAMLAAVIVIATGGGALAASSRTVKVSDNFYAPRTLRVTHGTKVVWSFRGQIPHNVQVTSGPELFSSRILRSGTYTRTLRRRGTYRIVCSLHENMTMKVVVR